MRVKDNVILKYDIINKKDNSILMNDLSVNDMKKLYSIYTDKKLDVMVICNVIKITVNNETKENKNK